MKIAPPTITTNTPPLTITPTIVGLVAEISEKVGVLSAQPEHKNTLRLRRVNRIRTIQGSLAIEGNTLSEAQITAILEGKQVVAPPREIQEARNAITAYEQFEQWIPTNQNHLLKAHQILMKGLIDNAGHYRSNNVGVMNGEQVIHMAPQADRIRQLMQQLLLWLKNCELHPLISSSVFHYEFEFIHPFADGNGRMGRLWQTLILSQWNPLFAHIPVESIVHSHQSDYYYAINQSTQQTDSAPFVEFMLAIILETVTTITPQVTPHATPQVRRLLSLLSKSMSRAELQEALGLKDRKSFQQRYLLPALESGLIEMTIPEKPRSRLQQYRLTQAGQTAKQIHS